MASLHFATISWLGIAFTAYSVALVMERRRSPAFIAGAVLFGIAAVSQLRVTANELVDEPTLEVFMVGTDKIGLVPPLLAAVVVAVASLVHLGASKRGR